MSKEKTTDEILAAALAETPKELEMSEVNGVSVEVENPIPIEKPKEEKKAEKAKPKKDSLKKTYGKFMS